MHEQDILYWGIRLYERGLSPAKSGNVSIRTDKGVLITASGTCLNDMDSSDLILVDYDGNVVDENGEVVSKPKKRPSSEMYLHLEIYSEREDINAIIHSHAPFITAFAAAHKPIENPILVEFAHEFEYVPLVKYELPSSIKLAAKTAEPFKQGFNAALMANHGVVVGSDTLQSAFYSIEALSAYCETYFGAQVLGGGKPLTGRQIKDIQKLKG